jgi:hypothetical protein
LAHPNQLHPSQIEIIKKYSYVEDQQLVRIFVKKAAKMLNPKDSSDFKFRKYLPRMEYFETIKPLPEEKITGRSEVTQLWKNRKEMTSKRKKRRKTGRRR